MAEAQAKRNKQLLELFKEPDPVADTTAEDTNASDGKAKEEKPLSEQLIDLLKAGADPKVTTEVSKENILHILFRQATPEIALKVFERLWAYEQKDSTTNFMYELLWAPDVNGITPVTIIKTTKKDLKDLKDIKESAEEQQEKLDEYKIQEKNEKNVAEEQLDKTNTDDDNTSTTSSDYQDAEDAEDIETPLVTNANTQSQEEKGNPPTEEAIKSYIQQHRIYLELYWKCYLVERPVETNNPLKEIEEFIKFSKLNDHESIVELQNALTNAKNLTRNELQAIRRVLRVLYTFLSKRNPELPSAAPSEIPEYVSWQICDDIKTLYNRNEIRELLLNARNSNHDSLYDLTHFSIYHYNLLKPTRLPTIAARGLHHVKVELRNYNDSIDKDNPTKSEEDLKESKGDQKKVLTSQLVRLERDLKRLENHLIKLMRKKPKYSDAIKSIMLETDTFLNTILMEDQLNSEQLEADLQNFNGKISKSLEKISRSPVFVLYAGGLIGAAVSAAITVAFFHFGLGHDFSESFPKDAVTYVAAGGLLVGMMASLWTYRALPEQKIEKVLRNVPLLISQSEVFNETLQKIATAKESEKGTERRNCLDQLESGVRRLSIAVTEESCKNVDKKIDGILKETKKLVDAVLGDKDEDSADGFKPLTLTAVNDYRNKINTLAKDLPNSYSKAALYGALGLIVGALVSLVSFNLDLTYKGLCLTLGAGMLGAGVGYEQGRSKHHFDGIERALPKI